ncbi:hypothetical protein N7461_007178 [Penicillium sp. DV-2018c]|nr:hypothetical protein N7461_007178 [Penicillium sp. DV-2018c]
MDSPSLGTTWAWIVSARLPSSVFQQPGATHRFQTTLFNHLGHLPDEVLNAESDRWELVYHLFYLLRFLRYVDPTWDQVLANPLPALTPLLAPGVQVPAVTVPPGFPGTGPADAGFPNGWPVGPPAIIPVLPPAPPAPASSAPVSPGPASPADFPLVIGFTAINAPPSTAAHHEDDDSLADDSAEDFAEDSDDDSADDSADQR